MIPTPLPDLQNPADFPPSLWSDDFPVDEPESERLPDETPLPNPDENREPPRYCQRNTPLH